MTTGIQISRRNKLLDSAEGLFATDSYHGVSLKQISKDSGVNLGLINYYFGTKENLLKEVIARRSGEFIGRVRRNHDLFESDIESGSPSFIALLRAHFMPFVEYAVSKNRGERDYIRIIVDVELWQNLGSGGAGDELWDISIKLFNLAKRCFPHADEQHLRVALYLAGTTMSYMFRDTWALAEMTNGRFHQDNLDEMFGLVLKFFAGGTETVVAR